VNTFDDPSPIVHAGKASRFLSRWLAAGPERAAHIDMLAAAPLDKPAFAWLLQQERDGGATLAGAMRRVRNLVLATLICRDLGRRADLSEVLSVITAFAEFAVSVHYAALHEEMAALYGTPVGDDTGRVQHMIVIGMGKLGGGELNVSSDIDLIFLYPEDGETKTATPGQKGLSNHEFFIRLGKKLIGALSDLTEDGFTFRVDMALRPNGSSGPLAASFNMLEEYLIVQGREWERYAWVKARALTGDAEDIATLENIVRPFVYRRYLDFGSIDAMRAMHSQIRAEVKRQEARHPERSHNVKLGRGGIREIEFIAQVFQLIRGGREPALRDHSTRATLKIVARMQLLDPDVVAKLEEAYTFLRNLEHRIQYLDDAQTHILPAAEEDRLIIAQMAGYADVPSLMAGLDVHRRFVAERFDVIFGEPEAAPDTHGEATVSAGISDDDSPEAMMPILAQLGFADAEKDASRLAMTWASPRLRMLSEASRSRLVALINGALPIIGNLPDRRSATLHRLLDFLEAIGRRAAYLSLLTEYPPTLTRVIGMMHASGWAATYLTRHPILLDELIDEAALDTPPDWPAFAADCRRQLQTARGDPERQMDLLREIHHAQQFRLLSQDLDGRLSLERLADHLSMLADILIAVTLEAVWDTIANRHRDVPQFAVIAYGKLGGKELGYASDLDLVFLYDDDDQDAPPLYAKLAQRFITWMTSHTPAGTLFDVDIALRPDGASGLLVTTVNSFERYQRHSAWIWEHQALTRTRYCAGDAAIGARFESIREDVLQQPRDAVRLRAEVLSMRQKMHAQHPNASGLFDLKHDAGGMIDIEFLVQFMVLRDAHTHPQLTADIGNIALLGLLGSLGLIDAELGRKAADAYRLFRRLQHGIRLQGAERARVPFERVQGDIAVVTTLWQQVFG
jgi:glutamate-ammonia-ligase adenylyltransferase